MGIMIMPTLMKVNFHLDRPLNVALAISDLFGFNPDAMIHTSAGSRKGITSVIDAFCQ